MIKNIIDNTYYIGVNDFETDLFEGQYSVPNGISYNSYVIMDEKIAVLDTVDSCKAGEYFANLEELLNNTSPDYLVLNHLEPDHSGSLEMFLEKYPLVKLVGNAKTFSMLPKFIKSDFSKNQVVVSEGEEICLGKSTLSFYMAPMVHWPEAMVTYNKTNKVLFSADAFGTFSTFEGNGEWLSEARRYYINIVGKYGTPVLTLLKKAASLDIETICPLHGPVLRENLGFYIDKYKTWASYAPETDGVFVCYASLHKHTAAVARGFANALKEDGVEVSVADLAREDFSACVAKAFQYSKIVFAASSYDGGVMPAMEKFLAHLKAKSFQSRKVGLIENGAWAPSAAKTMRAALEAMKGIEICEPVVTINVNPDADCMEALAKLKENIK